MKNQRKTLDAVDRRLSWYDDAKYGGLEMLTELGLYFQIEVRRHLLYCLDAYKEDEEQLPASLLSQIHCVRDNPVVTLRTIRDRHLRLHDFFHLAEFMTYNDPMKSVAPISFGGLIRHVETILTGIEFEDSVAAREGSEPEGRPWISPRLIERGFARRGELKYKYSGRAAGQLLPGAVELLQLDLSAPDKDLRNDFNKFLLESRRARPIEINQEPFPALNWKPARQRAQSERPWSFSRRNILDGKLIQFLDLLIWEKQNGLTIPPLTKASLLFHNRQLKRKKRQLMRSASTRNTTSEAKKAGNRVSTTETNAAALMDATNPANADLIKRASQELEQAYKSAKRGVYSPSNRDFIPSEKERLDTRKKLEECWFPDSSDK